MCFFRYVMVLKVKFKQDFKVLKTAFNVAGGGGHILIYLCSAQLISFKIDCFYGL